MDAGNLKALKYLIRVSPTGEMQDIIHHLVTLVGSQQALESSPEIVQALKKWYEQHRYHILLPGDRVGLVTTAGAAGDAFNGDFIYYDNVLNITFKFNPFSLAASVVSEEPMQLATSTFHG